MLGGGGGRTRQKYKCKADGCQVTSMGVNLSKHYKVNTDWVLLKELKPKPRKSAFIKNSSFEINRDPW